MADDTSASPAPESAEASEPVPSGAPATELQAELEQLRARVDELHANWQRSAADLINYRRRVEQEREDLHKFAAQDVISEFLAVLDDWERALATLPPEMMRFTWIQGVAQIYQKMTWTLSRHGVSAIEAADQPFDPRFHEAVMREDDVDASEQTHVVAELQRGYRIHERVLRPALVKVGPPAADVSAPEPSADVNEAQPSANDM